MSDALSNLKALTRPHVDSFDWFIEHGLDESVLQLPPRIHERFAQMVVESAVFEAP